MNEEDPERDRAIQVKEEEEEEEQEDSLFIASAVNEDSSEQEGLWKEEVRSVRGPGAWRGRGASGGGGGVYSKLTQ